jgi:nucleoside-diphosphate-sugar epimerase
LGDEEDAGLVKILVTGGGGFLGTAICCQLRRLGHQVAAFQRGNAQHLHRQDIRVYQGDICDQVALTEAAQGCDAVIHTAGKAGIWGKDEDYERVNVGGTQNVIGVCRDLRIPILIHTSSPSVIHGGSDIEGGDESLPLETRFLSPYPASKASAEILMLAANSGELKTTALRPHLIWGPGDPHILPRLAAKVRRGRLALPGVNKLVDTVFVENAARAHIDALIELSTGGRCAGKAYFISNDEPLPQGEIIRRLLAAIGIKAEILPVPAFAARGAGMICEIVWRVLGLASEPPVTRFSADQLCTAHWYNISAAKRDLGYRPDISIVEGLIKLQQCTR